MVQYKVVGPCAHATVDGPHGRRNQLHFKGTLLPPDVPEVEIRHLLSVKLIAPVQVGAAAPALSPVAPVGDNAGDREPPGQEADADEQPPADDTAGEDDSTEQADPAEQAGPAEQDVEARRAAARAKLPADGSPPDRRNGQQVWVEYLATKGYDYAALVKEAKKALMELAGSLQGQ